MYQHIAVGGTFDGLHKGHQQFLEAAIVASSRVTIGLTSTQYIRRYKKNKGVAAYSSRYRTLITWLRKRGVADRATVIPIHDPYGPAVLAGDIDAIAVTADNRHVGEAINQERRARGLPVLAILEVALVPAQDWKPISSTRIRNKEIDREGRLYLPSNIRDQLQQPMGPLYTGAEISTAIASVQDQIVVTVGDATTHTFFSHGMQPSLVIIDTRVNRKPFQSVNEYKFPKKYRIVRVVSGPGFISQTAIDAIKEWSKSVRVRTVIVVDGEEDLLTIPAVMYAPVGSFVLYGQPKGQLWACGPVYQGGIVKVAVTNSLKTEAASILSKFTS